MSKLNYFLIKDHCRDGEHEYYDEVVVETKMTHKDLRENKNFWEECFLAWQFHHIEQDSNDDWWAGLRIVSIYDFKSITKEQYEVFADVIGAWSLEHIIKEGAWDYDPSTENFKDYEEHFEKLEEETDEDTEE